jgi:hypothetical protein
VEIIKPTPVEELRKQHPDQDAIDAASAELLRATAPWPSQPAPAVVADSSRWLQRPARAQQGSAGSR